VYILGICDSQDAGAVLLDTDTNRITAVNEERISRIKLSRGFPQKAVLKLIRISGIEPQQINMVAVASKMTPAFILRSLRKWHDKIKQTNSQFSMLLACYIMYQVIARTSLILEFIESRMSALVFKLKLNRLKIKAKVKMVEHHLAHVYGAYISSGMPEALIFSIDGLGDGVSFSVNIGKNGKIKRICEQKAINDITLYYSRLTEFLGFSPIRDEGKVMGLAAYSNNYSCLKQAQQLLRIKNGKFKKRNIFYAFSKDKKIFQQLRSKPKKEVAASFQLHAENTICRLVDYWVKKTGISKVALSGGFFANIKVNQSIARLERVSQLYVYPHMGDGGLALGAACYLWPQQPFKFKNLFLGPEFDDQHVEQVLKKSGLRYEKIDNIEEKTAFLLSRGKIVARFNGAMEYGPRALGNRSILAQATDSSIQYSLNQKLGRDDFMPFAPAVLIEKKDECCFHTEKAVYSAEFMNMSFDCRRDFIDKCPAAVHKDGTARAQLVSRENNPGLHKILSIYEHYTGIPALLNTSFNVHEEPIVCSPEDALISFKKAKIDYLAINNFIVKGVGDEK
jgi:carbamoyltransferase